MSFANPSYTDLLTTAVESRTKQIRDNVSKNTALLFRLKEKGKVRPVSGGTSILEELSFAENGNFQWYSGWDPLAVAQQDVISAASFAWKQAAASVVINGLEELQNSGREKTIDLLDARSDVASKTMTNQICSGMYADGTGNGGKQITGLGAAVVANPATGTYGGIDPASFTFWRNQFTGSLGSQTTSNILANMMNLWVKLVRNSDHPDLIMSDSNLYATYNMALQNQQRFTDPKLAQAGFTTVKFQTADVVLDGGIGGFCPANVMFFLNTDYIYYRPHKDRDMVALSPDKRSPINQDGYVKIIGWAGNMTCSGRQYQGYFQGS